MNTKPIDPILSQERLSDLAQFAVPESHDLWPRIERAARRSATDVTTTRPSILSLGLSRAWTAVGLLLIAATFAVLGLGLLMLVVSNGHDQVPAAQPDSTVTPTPTGTAIPTVEATRQPTSTPEMESAAAGEAPSGSQAQHDGAEPTLTPSPEPVPTLKPTTAPTMASTPTPSITPTFTVTPTHSPPPTTTPTHTPLPTATPTATPTPMPTSTPTPLPTATPTATHTLSTTATPTFTATPTLTSTPEPIYAEVTVPENPPESYYWIRANGSKLKVNNIRDPAPASDEVAEGMRLVALDITQMASEDDQQHSLSYFSARDVGGNVFNANSLTSLRPLFGEGRLDNNQSFRGWVSFTLPDFALIDSFRFVKNVDSVGVQIASFKPFVGLNVDGRSIHVRISRFERVTGHVSFQITASRPECAGDDFGKLLAVRPPYHPLMTYETDIPATCTRGSVTFEATTFINGLEQASATTSHSFP